MARNDELIAIKLKLKGQREAIAGIKSVDKAQQGLSTSTTATGTAAAKAEKKTSRLSRAYASLGKTARWGIGFLGVGGVFALKSAIDKTAELSKATSGLSRNFGFQTNVASRWASLAHARDIDTKALSMSFGTLGSKMVEAGRKGGTALTPFHQLGMTQEEVVRGSKDLEWGLMRVTKALGDMEGGAKRTTAAKAVLGKGFLTVGPLMSEGTKGLKEQLHWADKYGSLLDTKTNDSIMEMVMAQRENKAAMFGLQVQIASHFAPAIVAASDAFQQFVAMLNSDDLTTDQKLHRIEQQFLGIEDTLIQIISDALPRVAEHGGELGVKLAGAVWHGFWHSDLGGKLVIGAWIFNMFGGEALVKAGAKKVGGKIGMSMGIGLVAGASGFLLGWELGKLLEEKTHGEFHQWGINAGENFVNGMVDAINFGMDKANLLSFLGIDAPNIHHVNLHDPRERQERGEHVTHPLLPPGRVPPGSEGPGITSPLPKDHQHRRGAHIETPRLPRIDMAAWGRPIVVRVEHQTVLDGRVIAENTAQHVAAAEALS